MFEYFDIHSHLNVPDFDLDRDEQIGKMKEQKIGTTMVGVDFESSKNIVDLAGEHDNLFACVGQHPDDLTPNSVFDDRLELLANNKKTVAIGECGLDYFRLSSMLGGDGLKGIQKTVFEYHIDLALSVGKPLMLHVRPSKGTMDAYADTLDVLEHHAKLSGNKLKGNAHFFAGDKDILKRFLDIGFTVSFTGVLTFTSDYDELVRYTPLDMIMAETDAPFVAPTPYRGQRNSPLYVPEVVKKIAELKAHSYKGVKEVLMANVLRNFPQISAIAPQPEL
ncbi:MAG: Hydrolase, TatD family [Patescibacteria group bacterium]|nr:Hydrolase, TatD family [Patescibacteria group bacterium]